ncbi:MAG: ATP synthase F0 subunit B [Myxococcota bacterium]
MFLLSSGALIDLDGTLVVQLILFFVAFGILHPLVFKPMVALFEAREQATDGARAEARRMEHEAKEKADKFEEEMHQIRMSAAAERERLRQEGQRLEKTILERVRQETQKQSADAEAKVQAEARRVRSDMETAIPQLARQIAAKLLGREVA